MRVLRIVRGGRPSRRVQRRAFSMETAAQRRESTAGPEPAQGPRSRAASSPRAQVIVFCLALRLNPIHLPSTRHRCISRDPTVGARTAFPTAHLRQVWRQSPWPGDRKSRSNATTRSGIEPDRIGVHLKLLMESNPQRDRLTDQAGKGGVRRIGGCVVPHRRRLPGGILHGEVILGLGHIPGRRGRQDGTATRATSRRAFARLGVTRTVQWDGVARRPSCRPSR